MPFPEIVVTLNPYRRRISSVSNAGSSAGAFARVRVSRASRRARKDSRRLCAYSWGTELGVRYPYPVLTRSVTHSYHCSFVRPCVMATISMVMLSQPIPAPEVVSGARQCSNINSAISVNSEPWDTWYRTKSTTSCELRQSQIPVDKNSHCKSQKLDLCNKQCRPSQARTKNSSSSEIS